MIGEEIGKGLGFEKSQKRLEKRTRYCTDTVQTNLIVRVKAIHGRTRLIVPDDLRIVLCVTKMLLFLMSNIMINTLFITL